MAEYSNGPGRVRRKEWKPADRIALLRYWREDRDYAEISELMGRPYGSIQSMVCRLGKSDKGATSLARVRVLKLAREECVRKAGYRLVDEVPAPPT